MASLATAFVAVVPSLEGFEKQLKAELEPAIKNAGTDAGKKAGGFFSGALKTTLAVGAVAAGAAVAGVGATLTAGFRRLSGLENARNLLDGIGLSAGEVEGTMDSALQAVRNTAFSLDAAAGVAASAVAAGVQQGDELTGYLSTIADVASVSGSSLEEIGGIMNGVTTANKASNQELQQLSARGLPVYQMLAKEAGVSAEEIQKMAASGEISAEMLGSALENNLGGAALKAGETTQGAFANMQTAVGRLGATFLEDLFPLFGDLFTGVTEALAPLEDAAGEIGADLANSLGPVIEELIAMLPGLFESIVPLLPLIVELGGALAIAFVEIMPVVMDVIAALIPVIMALLPVFLDLLPLFLELAQTLLPVLVDLFNQLVPIIEVLAPPIVDLAGAIGETLGEAISGAVEMGRELTTWIIENKDLMLTLVAAIGGGAIAFGLFTIAVNAARIATGVMAAVTKFAAGVQAVFNFIMMLNPIMLVVVAVAALTAGLIFFFTQTEAGQEAWAAFTGFLGSLWEGLQAGFASLLEVFAGLWEWFTGIPQLIIDALSAAGAFLLEVGKNILQGLWDGILFIWELIKFWYIDMPKLILGLLAGALTWLLDTGKNILQGLWDGIVAGYVAVAEWFGALYDAVSDFFAAAGEWLVNAGENILQGLWDGILAIWEFIKWWYMDMPELILDLLSDAGTWLLQAGKDIMDGLWDGIKEVAGNIWNWMQDWGSDWVNSVKDMFKIKSPSKVFEEIGEALGDGLALGLEGTEADVNSQINSLVSIPNMPETGNMASVPVINYYAAPNKSFNARQELEIAMRRVSVMSA